jgi:hypothetical protein
MTFAPNLLSWETFVDPARFNALKLALVDATGLSKDALHVYVGLVIFLSLYAVLGRRWWSALTAWCILLALTLWGEHLDTANFFGVVDIKLGETEGSRRDIWNTMFWPTFLALFGPLLFGRRRKKKTASAGGSGDSADEALE